MPKLVSHGFKKYMPLDKQMKKVSLMVFDC